MRSLKHARLFMAIFFFCADNNCLGSEPEVFDESSDKLYESAERVLPELSQALEPFLPPVLFLTIMGYLGKKAWKPDYKMSDKLQNVARAGFSLDESSLVLQTKGPVSRLELLPFKTLKSVSYNFPGNGQESSCVSHDNSLFVIAQGSDINLWSLKEKRIIGAFKGFEEPVSDILMNNAGTVLLGAISTKGMMRTWDFKTRRALQVMHDTSNNDCAWPVAFTNDDTGILVQRGPQDKELAEARSLRMELWGLVSGKNETGELAKGYNVEGIMDITRNKRYIVLANEADPKMDKNNYQLIDLLSKEVVNQFKIPAERSLSMIQFSPCSRYVAMSLGADAFMLYTIGNNVKGTVCQQRSGFKVDDLIINSRGNLIVTLSSEGRSVLWRSGVLPGISDIRKNIPAVENQKKRKAPSD